MYGSNSSRTSRRTWHQGQYSSSFNRAYEKKEPTSAQLMQNLGDELLTIPFPSTTGHSKPVSIQDFKEIASYNWLDSNDHPTIIVPGSPRIWRERQMPYSVPRDTGTVFVDQNASRLSTSPLLPLIAAVMHHAPSFPLASVDFVTDRNGLRKLWRWASGDESGTFRIDVDLVGKRTILMQRWEPAATQQGGPGYEREFEKASTTPANGCEGATGHHRIVTYDLDGLNILMRFKVDAFLPAQRDSDKDPLDSLTSELEGLNVSKPHDTTELRIPTFGGAYLSIIPTGELVQQTSLVEIKTRSIKSVEHFQWDDAYPQLLLSQTPHIFVCVHNRGEFQTVQKRTLENLETEELGRKAHEKLRKLRKVMGEIRDIVTEEGEGTRLGLVCRGGELLVYKTKSTDRCLPPAVLKKFA